jgi:alkane 1-monooxygenase
MTDLTSRPLPMVLFAAAALSPLALFALGLGYGGVWAFGGLLYMAVLSLLLDQIKGLFMGNAPEGAEFPAADALLVALAFGHLAALPLIVWGVAGDSGLGPVARVALFAGAGLWFGQVSNPMAHELIHRGGRELYGFGVAVYTSLLFGHHASAHRLVHHRHAASAEDPNSARSGEGFYRFFFRAWGGSFRRGWQAETDLRSRGGAAVRPWGHPYAVYLVGAAVALGLAYAIAGFWGLCVWVGLALHAQVQLMLSDYVQHYGLARARRADGRLEPVGPRHSWNAPHWFSSAMMLNAPRHSDHHAHPARPYPALRLPAPQEAPQLPWPLPVACTLALFPPLWKRAIRPHLAPWRVV